METLVNVLERRKKNISFTPVAHVGFKPVKERE
jgi:hypothetical protein